MKDQTPITTTGNPIIDGSLDFSKQGFTETGICCILDKTLTAYAQRKGLKGVQVLLTIDTEKRMSRLIVKNGVPEFESQGIEDIACRLDIMAVAGDESSDRKS